MSREKNFVLVQGTMKLWNGLHCTDRVSMSGEQVIFLQNGEAWLKFPEIWRRVSGCCVCSLLTAESRTSQAVSALAEGGMYTTTMRACADSLSW